MYCNSCGKQVIDGVEFCTHCGAFMHTSPRGPAPTQGTAQQAYAPYFQPFEPVPPQQAYAVPAQPYTGPAQRAKKQKTVPIIIAATAVVLLAIVGVFLFLSTNKEASDQGTTSINPPANQGTTVTDPPSAQPPVTAIQPEPTKPNYIGKYVLTSMTIDGITIEGDLLDQALGGAGAAHEVILEIKDDSSLTLSLPGEDLASARYKVDGNTLTWSEYDADGTTEFKLVVDGDIATLSFELTGTASTMVFKKQ